ncbi:MAG TPA: hydrogenase iron-sulfur subunit [Candidatus Baltobacteraceae bacterium]|nr:hydrogenase iron-sulfur subunit [Candidatus Baltobacteraceae bacterium]
MKAETKPVEKPASSSWEPALVAFLCNWCSYAGADLAGSSRLNYPPNVRVVRVPCSGRVNPMFVMHCFKRGFDGVLIAGCHPGDCHYAKGNYYARRRIPLAKDFLGFLGIEPERIKFDWVSAAESGRFVSVVRELTESVRKLGPFAVKARNGFPSLPTGVQVVNE